MYEEFYQLKADPFRLTPTGKHIYEHSSYRKSRAYLEYALKRREGIVMIYGPPGTGKTSLVKAVVQSMAGSRMQINVLSCNKLAAQDLLRLYAADLGIELESHDVGSLLIGIGRELTRLGNSGVQSVLILDEAQGLTIGALEQTRLLTNYQNGNTPLLQIVLIGQPDLQRKVMSAELTQLHQRIISSTSLNFLTFEETRDYFLHRLTAADWNGNPAFDEDIYQILFSASAGIPRCINQIGSRLLLHGYVERKKEIGLIEIREVVSDLFGEQLLPCSVDVVNSDSASVIGDDFHDDGF